MMTFLIPMGKVNSIHYKSILIASICIKMIGNPMLMLFKELTNFNHVNNFFECINSHHSILIGDIQFIPRLAFIILFFIRLLVRLTKIINYSTWTVMDSKKNQLSARCELWRETGRKNKWTDSVYKSNDWFLEMRIKQQQQQHCCSQSTIWCYTLYKVQQL